MIYSHEVQTMCPVAQGVNHGPAPIPEEAKWVSYITFAPGFSDSHFYVTHL